MPNFHKKGEDVLNNFPKTLTKGVSELERAVRKAAPRFNLRGDLRRSATLLQRFEQDPIVL